MEQEYVLFDGSRPLGFGSDRRFPPEQGPYYCGVGADQVYGRDLVEDHMDSCCEAGIMLSGINAEVMPGQWEFQVGPCTALQGGDHLWLARWLLYRIGEDYGLNATLDPKPVPGDWNGSGMHTNFSTGAMRAPGGMALIEEWCEKASSQDRIEAHLAAYGDGIEMRLTGKHETCSYKDFKYGVSDRTASIRIPLGTAQDGYGYLEDRRPNANSCPYQVALEMLVTDSK
jgi:glutamine synthetase